MRLSFALGVCALALVFAGPSALAASSSLQSLTASIHKGKFSSVRPYLKAHPRDTDQVVRTLLSYAQGKMAKHPGSAAEAVSLAKAYARLITPASVPQVCSGVRRVVHALPAKAKSKHAKLYSSVSSMTEAFAKAPVVLSAGRPNLCEQAWVQGFDGDQAALVQAPASSRVGFLPNLEKPTAPVTPISTRAPALSDMTKAIAAGEISSVSSYLDSHPEDTDTLVQALLDLAKREMMTNPDLAARAMTLASQYAARITPPSVPPVCTSVRQIVSLLPLDAKTKKPELFAMIMGASQTFVKAPVVVAAGRPNLCEEPWNEDAELAQQPGFGAPNVRAYLPKPPVPPSYPPENPSSPQ